MTPRAKQTSFDRLAMSLPTNKNVVTLSCANGHLFEVDEKVAKRVPTIKSMMDEQQQQCRSLSRTIQLPNVDPTALGFVLAYCYKHAEERAGAADLDAFDKELVDRVEPSSVFGVIRTANYLGVEGLLNVLYFKK